MTTVVPAVVWIGLFGCVIVTSRTCRNPRNSDPRTSPPRGRCLEAFLLVSGAERILKKLDKQTQYPAARGYLKGGDLVKYSHPFRNLMCMLDSTRAGRSQPNSGTRGCT